MQLPQPSALKLLSNGPRLSYFTMKILENGFIFQIIYYNENV